MEKLWNDLKLGLQEFLKTNNITKVIVGASGGLDSSLLLVLASEVLPSENVLGVAMPSKYTSFESNRDAELLSHNLGTMFRTIPIEKIVESFQNSLHLTGVSEENLQARVRAVILMGISNSEGGVVLCPTNKSESAIGYSTLYGDTVGAYAPFYDVKKTDLYKLAKWVNKAGDDKIPAYVIERKPSAELSHGQTDQDLLPPYEVLDSIIHDYVEKGFAQKEVCEKYGKLGEEIVEKIVFYRWKRLQEPVGIRTTERTLKEFDEQMEDVTEPTIPRDKKEQYNDR